MRIKLTISYVGTGFCGWQVQPQKRSVQSELEAALTRLFGERILATASGRTDGGVHALGQAVHFDAPKPLPPVRIAAALNRFLPPEIAVLQAEEVAFDFNARKSAHKKTYEYRAYFSEQDNPFLLGRVARLSGAYDVPAMIAAASAFEGTHDFAAFRLLGSSAKTTVRTIYECTLKEDAPDFYMAALSALPAKFSQESAQFRPPLLLTVSANGFLYKMVRLIMGALIEVGKGKLSAEQIREMLLTGETAWVKKPATGEGLYLKSVEY